MTQASDGIQRWRQGAIKELRIGTFFLQSRYTPWRRLGGEEV
jgi:hypothetical protein